MTRKIVFLTGTRADFGKLKSLLRAVEASPRFDCHIFVTGMHLLEKYGATAHEVFQQGYRNIYLYNNAAFAEGMDISLANTIVGLSSYVRDVQPDLIVVHGDRPEAMAGAIVGSFNNIRVAHIEGGELSGTIDGLTRHAVSKLAHVHLVTNESAGARLLQMGEADNSVFVIGSPELDIMLSENLPAVAGVKEYYDIPFGRYALFMYHPVTTELDRLEHHVNEVIAALKSSRLNYVVLYPNNDLGNDIILNAFDQIRDHERFRILPSMKFEYFMTLLKHAEFIIGNSSCVVREAPVYGLPSLNLGTRQNRRGKSASITHIQEDRELILKTIRGLKRDRIKYTPESRFGDGHSAERFMEILNDDALWDLPYQKQFVELDS